MVRYTGLIGKIGNCSTLSGPTRYNQERIGDVAEFEVLGRGEVYTVPDLGNPYLRAVETALVRPELNLEYHPQNTSFLHSYLIVQTGNNLSSFQISYYANSADYGALVGAYPGRVEVVCDRTRPLTVRANILGLQWSSGLETSAGNYANDSTAGLTAMGVTYVGLKDGGTEIRDLSTLWRRWSFQVDYRSRHIHTGTTILPTDVLAGVREVTGQIECSLTNASNFMPYVSNASVLNVHIGAQNAPMSSYYIFFSSIIRANQVRVPGVDVQRLRIDFQTRYITRSSL